MSDSFKRLFRSRTETRLAGVCGGIGVFFNIDPVLIRLAWVFGTAISGVVPGILAYFVAWLIVPEAPRVIYAEPVEPTVNEN